MLRIHIFTMKQRKQNNRAWTVVMNPVGHKQLRKFIFCISLPAWRAEGEGDVVVEGGGTHSSSSVDSCSSQQGSRNTARSLLNKITSIMSYLPILYLNKFGNIVLTILHHPYNATYFYILLKVPRTHYLTEHSV